MARRRQIRHSHSVLAALFLQVICVYWVQHPSHHAHATSSGLFNLSDPTATTEAALTTTDITEQEQSCFIVVEKSSQYVNISCEWPNDECRMRVSVTPGCKAVVQVSNGTLTGMDYIIWDSNQSESGLYASISTVHTGCSVEFNSSIVNVYFRANVTLVWNVLKSNQLMGQYSSKCFTEQYANAVWCTSSKKCTRCELGCSKRNQCSLQERSEFVSYHNGRRQRTMIVCPSNVTYLNFSWNELAAIAPRSFQTIGKHVRRLNLSHNRLVELQRDVFYGLENLTGLNLAHNLLRSIHSGTFNDLGKLEYLGLKHNSFQKSQKIDIDAFRPLVHLKKVSVSRTAICQCWHFPTNQGSEESNFTCNHPPSSYATCKNLIPYVPLKMYVWAVAIFAMAGNAFVILWRKTHRPIEHEVQEILIRQLAAADFLMGFYVLIIASADIHLGSDFPLNSEKWRKSAPCSTASALAIISSEASVFFLTLISFDRMIRVGCPFSFRKLNKSKVCVLSTVIWLLSLFFGVIMAILASNAKDGNDVYENSNMCINIPLIQPSNQNSSTIDSKNRNALTKGEKKHEKEPGIYLSIALFIILNTLCFLIMFVCYTIIIITMWQSARRVAINGAEAVAHHHKNNADEIRVTKKVAAIVATDFLCWFPLALLGIAAQFDKELIQPDQYAIIVAVFLPINSAVNPFLYTIATVLCDRMKKRPSG